jgi:type IV pilus assembly protein PilC
VVIVVLLTKVLPVFDEVYASLGGKLTGVAGGLLALGRGLDAAMPVLCALMAVLVVVVLLFSLSNSFRDKLLYVWRQRYGDKGISRKINDARFAQALAMGLGSGLPLEEAVDLCATLLQDVPDAAKRCRMCASRLAEGGELAETMKEMDMLPASACRLLMLGVQSGNGDAVMEDIARRLSEESNQALENKVAQVEPTLVLGTSLLVGIILLSVMLPLMNIMTAIG